MDVYLKKSFNSLIPSDSQSEELLKKFKLDSIIKCKLTKPRNLKYHKKYFKLLNIVLENQEEYNSVDELLNNVKLKLKMYDIKYSFDKKPYPVFHSISFASMDDLKFEQLYNKTLSVLSDFLGVISTDLEDELLGFY